MKFQSITSRVPKSWFVLFGIWLTLLLGLVGWWGFFALDQAKTILQLEIKSGTPENIALESWKNTSRMLFWESSTFFLLIFFTSLVIVVILIRDRKRSRSIRAFFASFTHELKTPLTGIRLQAESLEESMDSLVGQLPADSSSLETRSNRNRQQIKQHIARLLQDVTRLESQVETTLELSRLEGGGSVFPRPISFAQWLNGFLQPYSDHFSNQIKFKIIDSSALKNGLEQFEILADPSVLQIVFRNLIENSIRHSGESLVEVKLEIDPQYSITNQNGNFVLIRYSDSGKRIHPGMVEKLGNLFFKGPYSNGAGVGLFLVKSLILKMKGTVRFLQTSSGGFMCEIELPYVPAGQTLINKKSDLPLAAAYLPQNEMRT